MATPTIYEIKEATQKKSPYFFSRNTLASFGQTMHSFTVKRSPMGRVYIYAPMHDRDGKDMGYTFREFTSGDLKNVRNEDGSLFTHDTLDAVLTYIAYH